MNFIMIRKEELLSDETDLEHYIYGEPTNKAMKSDNSAVHEHSWDKE